LPELVETLPDEVEVDDDEVTPPVEVETPPVLVETPPVEVETPPVEVVELEVTPPVVVVLVSPPVELEVEPPEVELEEPPVEVDDPPLEVEVEVEPPDVVVETTTLPPPLPPLPPKKPPKKPPPKPRPPEPPIRTGSLPPPEGAGMGGSCGSIGSAFNASGCTAGAAQETVLVTTRRIFFMRGAGAVRAILRFTTLAFALAGLACFTYWTCAAGASATWTAPPPTTAPPAATADNFTRAIRTDISSAFFASGRKRNDSYAIVMPLLAQKRRRKIKLQSR
jgi:hypothetical protein